MIIDHRQTTKKIGVDGLLIVIPGPPLGKPRQTQRDKWQKRPAVQRYRAWADLARLCAGPLPEPRLIARLDWKAYFAPPKSWSNKARDAAIGQLHRQKPDRDNIDKAVLDALFPEDSGIAAGTIAKFWDLEPRLEIVLTVEFDAPTPNDRKPARGFL